MREAGEGADVRKKTITYVAITALLLVMALLSFLVAPHGTGVKACMGFVFEQTKYTCLTNLALSSSNASVCGLMPVAYADSCYSGVAQRTNNSELCNSIRNRTQVYYACVAATSVMKNDYSACYSIGEPYRGSCLETIAVKLENQSLCIGAANVTSAETCTSVIGLRKMLQFRDAGYCRNVTASTDASVTSHIILNFSQSTNSTLSNNNLILGSLAFMPNVTFSARDFCYMVAASQFANGTLCSGVGNQQVRSLCLMQSGSVAGSNTQYNYTQMLSNCTQVGAYAQTCMQAAMLTQAINTRNASLCGELGSGMRETCYFSLAATYKNASYCNYITNASQRSSCLNST